MFKVFFGFVGDATQVKARIQLLVDTTSLEPTRLACFLFPPALSSDIHSSTGRI